MFTPTHSPPREACRKSQDHVHELPLNSTLFVCLLHARTHLLGQLVEKGRVCIISFHSNFHTLMNDDVKCTYLLGQLVEEVRVVLSASKEVFRLLGLACVVL